MAKIIDIENITAYRGRTRVFHHFSLAIEAGCNTVILGPNGAGKTTLLKLLAREIRPVHGADSSMKIFGREVWNVWELRSHLGLVSHDLQRDYGGRATGLEVVLSGFFSSIGIWKNHRFGAEQQDQASALMDRLGITHLRDKTFATMSTGEQRRFLLGRALVNDPDTLVLDEPTSGLDLKACFQYLQVMRALIGSGKCVVLVTHHLHEIPPEITHAVLLKGGEVIATGKKSEVLSSASLSALYETPVELLQASGFYRAIPA